MSAQRAIVLQCNRCTGNALLVLKETDEEARNFARQHAGWGSVVHKATSTVDDVCPSCMPAERLFWEKARELAAKGAKT